MNKLLRSIFYRIKLAQAFSNAENLKSLRYEKAEHKKNQVILNNFKDLVEIYSYFRSKNPSLIAIEISLEKKISSTKNSQEQNVSIKDIQQLS